MNIVELIDCDINTCIATVRYANGQTGIISFSELMGFLTDDLLKESPDSSLCRYKAVLDGYALSVFRLVASSPKGDSFVKYLCRLGLCMDTYLYFFGKDYLNALIQMGQICEISKNSSEFVVEAYCVLTHALYLCVDKQQWEPILTSFGVPSVIKKQIYKDIKTINGNSHKSSKKVVVRPVKKRR